MHLNCVIKVSSFAPDGLKYVVDHVRRESQSMYLLLTSVTVGVVLWNIPGSTSALMGRVSQLAAQLLLVLILFCHF